MARVEDGKHRMRYMVDSLMRYIEPRREARGARPEGGGLSRPGQARCLSYAAAGLSRPGQARMPILRGGRIEPTRTGKDAYPTRWQDWAGRDRQDAYPTWPAGRDAGARGARDYTNLKFEI